MNKTKVIIFVTFVLALGAGVAVGMLSSRSLPRERSGPARFIDELQLDPEQQKKMQEIWMSLMRDKGREFQQEYRSIQQQKEAEIAGLFSGEQAERYQQINAKYAQKVGELWKRGEQIFDEASKQTRAILNPSQQEKFDVMTSKFRAQRPPGAGEWFGPGMPGTMPSPSK